jgi:hypothetical protein
MFTCAWQGLGEASTPKGSIAPPLKMFIRARNNHGDEIVADHGKSAAGMIVAEELAFVENSRKEGAGGGLEEDGDEADQADEGGEGNGDEESFQLLDPGILVKVNEDCGGRKDPKGVAEILFGDERCAPEQS